MTNETAIAEAIKAQAIKDGHEDVDINDAGTMQDGKGYVDIFSHSEYFVNYNESFDNWVVEYLENAEKIVLNDDNTINFYEGTELEDKREKFWGTCNDNAQPLYTTSQLINIIENAGINISLAEFNNIIFDVSDINDGLTEVDMTVESGVRELLDEKLKQAVQATGLTAIELFNQSEQVRDFIKSDLEPDVGRELSQVKELPVSEVAQWLQDNQDENGFVDADGVPLYYVDFGNFIENWTTEDLNTNELIDLGEFTFTY